MVAASILPVSIHKGQLYFLFGKENEMEDSARGFSDFGGRVEKGESIIETASREGSEELCGFLGEPSNINMLIEKKSVYKIIHNDYHVHLFFIDYDENLPIYYNQHYKFLWERMDKHLLNDSKFFEKQEIKWFSIDDLRTSKEQFRNFYIDIVNKIIRNIKKIREQMGKNNKTMKKNVLKKTLKIGG